MLESITINNFTIIDRSHLEFGSGMTALTGETGAGKSILLDAIKLVLGDRADSDMVKSGNEKADISVSFDVSSLVEAGNWLAHNDLGDGEECLLRRVVQTSGRSKAYINGCPVTLNQLRQLGELLVDLHGQHEHQSLQKPAVQLQLLDASLPDQTLIEATQRYYKNWKELLQRRDQARDQSAQKQQRIDLLEMYCRELNELDLQPGELDDMQNEYSRLSHAGQILEITSALNSTLHENDEVNIQTLLTRCVQHIEQLHEIDTSLKDTPELLKNALIQVQEASSELSAYQQGIELDPARIDWLNERLSLAQSLARKHNIDVQQLLQFSQQLNNELDDLRLSEHDIQQLEKQLEQAGQEFLQQARELSCQRQSVARDLSAEITEVMQALGMQGGSFEIQLTASEDSAIYSSSGIDRVQFLVSANPGQPLKALNKVASGGELSRISLAIQVILSESSHIPTLIFDEVDSGIGGGIAEIVGRKLRQIANNRQVFCVTHLPQVASQAHQHYQVNKTKTEDSTTTEVLVLNEQQRLEEIARMLGGMTITDQTRAHAREMIENVA
jgi:DNA repair protein RecN (Recombination protein N)